MIHNYKYIEFVFMFMLTLNNNTHYLRLEAIKIHAKYLVV